MGQVGLYNLLNKNWGEPTHLLTGMNHQVSSLQTNHYQSKNAVEITINDYIHA